MAVNCSLHLGEQGGRSKLRVDWPVPAAYDDGRRPHGGTNDVSLEYPPNRLARNPPLAAQEKGGRLPGLHSSELAPLPEPAIRTGVRAMAAVVLDLFSTPSGAEGRK